MQVLVQYAGRFDTYVKDLTSVDKDFIHFTDSLRKSLGLDYPVNIETPLVGALQATQFISLFLDQVIQSLDS